jgi:hypothetical protein
MLELALLKMGGRVSAKRDQFMISRLAGTNRNPTGVLADPIEHTTKILDSILKLFRNRSTIFREGDYTASVAVPLPMAGMHYYVTTYVQYGESSSNSMR